MGKWDEQIKAAEENMKMLKKEKYIETETSGYLRTHPFRDSWAKQATLREAEHLAREKAEYATLQGKFEPKQGTIKVEHDHGFILMDLEGFKALPKAQQTKILKLGGQ